MRVLQTDNFRENKRMGVSITKIESARGSHLLFGNRLRLLRAYTNVLFRLLISPSYFNAAYLHAL